MRIGIDARLYKETGVGRYIQNLIRYLSFIDKKNEYLIFAENEVVFDIKLPSYWRVIPVDIRWHSFAEQFKFPLTLIKYDLDLMHFPYFSVPIFYPGRFIVTIHDVTNLNYATGRASTYPYLFYKFKYFAYRMVLFTSLIRSKKIIAPSRSTKGEIGRLLPLVKRKIAVTYEAGFDKINNKSIKLSFEPFFLYVGNVYPHKNLENGILAFKRLILERQNQIRLVIVGPEDFFVNRLKQFVKNQQMEGNVIFLGKVSDFELSNLYKRALSLFFPSISEGFGLPLIEALQHGCLVCCSSIPVFKEIAKDLPFYFDPNDVNSMFSTLKSVLSLTKFKRDELKKLGIKRAQDFSWEIMAKQTLNIYQEALI